MAAQPTPHPAVLMDDLVEEFLLRLPPEDPAALARAALVSRQWHRVITGPVFRRRFREFHRSAPLLGYIVNLHTSIRFVPMSSFRPPHAVRRDVRAIHSSRGRVLLQRSVGGGLNVIRHFGGDQEHLDFDLSVWDPITDEQRDLPVVPCPLTTSFWDAAVVCEDCNHLPCNFKVVFMGRTEERMIFSCFYSSEARGWSDPIFASGEDYGQFVRGTSVLVGRALYFKCGRSQEIVKYELLTHQMCRIGVQRGGTLIAAEDGRVGVAMAWDSTLRLLRREHGGWEESRAIELHTLLPDDAMCEIEAFGSRPFVAGFAEIGAGIIFLRTCVGYFIIDLNSGRTKKLGKYLRWHGRIVPYVSFCTPGAVFKDEGPGAGVAVSIDKVPGVAVAICRDEGLGAAVAVSTDEVPGAAVGVSTDEGLETGTVSSA